VDHSLILKFALASEPPNPENVLYLSSFSGFDMDCVYIYYVT